MRSIKENYNTEAATRLSPLVGLFVYPVTTIHYIMAELWGTISVSFLLWGYVNEITPKPKAKRYYATLGLGGQIGPLVGSRLVTTLKQKYGTGFRNFLKLLSSANAICVSFMLLFCAGYYFMHAYIMKLVQFKNTENKKKFKPKMSVFEAFQFSFNNKYVLALGGMVFGYYWVIVVSELTYKDLVKLETAGDQSSFAEYKALEQTLTSILAVFMMLFVAHNMIRILGWKITAMSAPVIFAVFASFLYGASLVIDVYHNETGNMVDNEKTHSTIICVYFGLLLVVVCKSIKYSAYDPTKEYAFLYLTKEQKYKGKIAVDIVGSRLGKGGAALVLNIIILNMIVGAEVTYIKKCLIVSSVAVGFGITIWIVSDLFIAKQMNIMDKRSQMKSANDTNQSIQVVSRDTTNKNGEISEIQSHY